MNRVLLVAVSSAVLMSSCATPSTLLVNEDGKVVRCAAHGYGNIGAPMAQNIASSCVSDARKMRYVDLPEAYLGLRFVNSDHSTKVTTVEVGSPAAAADVKLGDSVTHFDEQPIGNARDVLIYLGKKKAGNSIAIRVQRDNKPIELVGTLKSRSA